MLRIEPGALHMLDKPSANRAGFLALGFQYMDFGGVLGQDLNNLESPEKRASLRNYLDLAVLRSCLWEDCLVNWCRRT